MHPGSLLVRAGLFTTILSWNCTTRAQDSRPADTEELWFRNVRQVTRAEMGLDRSGEAYFSPDGQRISFQAYPSGSQEYQIYIMNLDGTGLKMISTGQGACTCSYWHPRGDKLIFASNHLDPRPAEMPDEVKQKAAQAGGRKYNWPFYPGMDIFEYTLATGQLRRLTTANGYDAEGSYSPDGKSIVYCGERAGDLDIYICDADGANSRRITRAPGYDGGPFFSPDGQRIVYRSDRCGLDSGTLQIFTNNLEGTNERAVTDHDVLNWCPFWHPSGQWLIFTRADHRAGRDVNYDLYLVRSDGSQMFRVTTDPAFDGLPVFSPDGRRLMWTSKRNGIPAPQIFVADVVGLAPDGQRRAAVDPVATATQPGR